MNTITTNTSSDPKITFLIQSDTVNIENYTIKDIPGSSGRLDVVARCILAALLNLDGFDEQIQIIVFFQRYGAYNFNTADLDYDIFPKDELQLSDELYHLIRNRHNREYLQNNPLGPLKVYDNSMIHYIQELQKEKGHGIFVLKESEEIFKNSLNSLLETKEIRDFIFIIGNQSEDFINSDAFLHLNLPEVSLGSQSYLASSVIRLIKIYLRKLDL
jgi:tRNA pseudouridine-54 N-methylase